MASKFVEGYLTDPRRKTNHLCSSPDIEYSQREGELQINIYSGAIVTYYNGSASSINPMLYWFHSMLWIGLVHSKWKTHQAEHWDTMKSDYYNKVVLEELIQRSLCESITTDGFHETYYALTEGCLPRALVPYGTLTEVMCMEKAWHTQIYLARSERYFVTFYWNTTA